MKVVQILSGPYDTQGLVWNVCLVHDGSSYWEEEIYYESMREAIGDFDDLRNQGFIELEEDYIDEEDMI